MTTEAKQPDTGASGQKSLLGEELLKTLHRLIKIAKVYEDNNQLLVESTEHFIRAVSQYCVDEDSITIQITRGRFYLQEEKLLYRRETINLIHEMLDYFGQRGLQGLRFYAALKDSPLEQILAFIRLLNQTEQQDDPPSWLLQQMEGDSFSWVEIVHAPETEAEPPPERKEKARRLYSNALSSVKEVSQKIHSHQQAGVRKAKRAVQTMVDLIQEDESLLLGLSTIRDYDDYTFTHSVNVALLSMFLGKRIGLSQTSLEMLGLCAMFHDLGKVQVPHNILCKPSKLTDQEFAVIKKHPWESVVQIVRLQTGRDLKPKIVLATFEHHLKYDLSGYPQTTRQEEVSLFGRIVAIADVFDAITSPRVYRKTAFSPDRALNVMFEAAGKDFDPLLLRVFANMLGVYPVGTLLLLDSGEMGLVTPSPEVADAARPHLLFLVPDGQGGFEKGSVVDLAERDPDTGSFRRNILKSLHPSTYGIQPAEFLL